MADYNALDYAINFLTFTRAGIMCKDPVTAYKMHQFLRVAILDNHIPIRKVVGFKVIAGKKLDYAYGDSIRLSHHPALGESYPELAKNLMDKVICTDVKDKEMDIELDLGINTADKVKIKLFGTDVKMVYSNPNIANHIGDDGTFAGNTGYVRIRLRTEMVNGYRSFADNSKIIPDEYFPCASDASLYDFVRVLPFEKGGNLISMRYYNNFTPEDLTDMLRVWKRAFDLNGISAEETEWLQSFNM